MCYSAMVVQDLKLLHRRFGAVPVRDSFEAYEVLSAQNPKKFKTLVDNPRIYPNYYAPIILNDGSLHKRVIKPMRYRIRPAFSDAEVPTKYNLFNARVDALEDRRTWKNIYMR